MANLDHSNQDGGLFKQSSELEILISAAIVFAAFQIHDIVPQLIVNLLNNNISGNSPVLVYVAIVALFLGTLLPISIVTHFIVRFYWLSLVGLRTAFSDTEKTGMGFAPRYMQKTFQSDFIDRHIQRVDRICSSIFAFSFLVIFAFCFSLFSVLMVISILGYFIDESPNAIVKYLLLFLLIVFLIMCILVLIDFFSLGALKRIKKNWFVKIYYPINKFMGWITFSFFYKGIYYTFIQRVSRKALVILLPAYVIIALVLLNLGYYESRLYTEDRVAYMMGANAMATSYYAENFDESSVIMAPFISSFVNTDEFLNLSVPITGQIDNWLVTSCDSVRPINEDGFHWRKWFKTGLHRRDFPDDFDFEKNAQYALDCFSQNVAISIDSMKFTGQKFRFKQIKTPEKIVLTTFIDIKDLDRGEHLLAVMLDSAMGRNHYKIPFLKK